MKGFGYFSASFRVSLFTSHYVLDAHHTAQVKGMPGEKRYGGKPGQGNSRNRREGPGPSLILLREDLSLRQLAREELGRKCHQHLFLAHLPLNQAVCPCSRHRPTYSSISGVLRSPTSPNIGPITRMLFNSKCS
jgi:hypothetical protein